MRGYFAIGVERISKPMNVGNLFRSAHAFGASFVFSIDARRSAFNAPSDTSRGTAHLPAYAWQDVDEMVLPRGCQLVGVELQEEATELPVFRHPLQAAYILGPERGNLSPKVLGRCDFTVKIPTKFCVNVGVAGAIVMYDRLLSMGGYGARPVHAGGEAEERPAHAFGGIFQRRRKPAPSADGEALTELDEPEGKI